MTFVAPWLLWALPAAALPVLFHLFFKVRKRAVPFPTLMFFLRIEPNLHARRKVREFLLLALRTLLIVLLVLALARPQVPALAGGGNLAVAVVLDNSGSMARTAGDGRPLSDIAAGCVAGLFNALGNGDRAALVLTVADPAVTLGEGATADAAALRAALDQVHPTEASGDPAAALRRAFAILAGTGAATSEVRIFSDLQAEEWDRAVSTLQPPAGCRITVHALRPGSAPVGVAISRIEPPSGRVIAGRPARATVVIKNSADHPATVRLVVSDDRGATTTTAVTVAAHAEQTAPALITPPDAGMHHALVQLDGEVFAPARRAGLALVAGVPTPVLLITPVRPQAGPDPYGLLAAALAPDGSGAVSGLAPERIVPARLSEGLARHPALVAVAWSALASCSESALRGYVAEGGTLLLLPAADDTVPPAAVPAWMGIMPGALVTLPKPLAGLVLDEHSACWNEVRDGQGRVEIGGLLIHRCQPLTVASGATAVLGLADGRAVVAEQVLGVGRIVGLGLAFHPGWSNLPLKGWSLALVQGLALRQSGDAGRVLQLTAGQSLPPAPSERGVMRIRTLSGGPFDWQGPRDQVPAFARAGVALVEVAGKPAWPVAVCASGSEADDRVSDGRTGMLASLAHRTVPVDDAHQVVEDWRAARRGTDLLPWMLLLILVVWAGEGWLGSTPAVRARPPIEVAHG